MPSLYSRGYQDSEEGGVAPESHRKSGVEPGMRPGPAEPHTGTYLFHGLKCRAKFPMGPGPVVHKHTLYVSIVCSRERASCNAIPQNEPLAWSPSVSPPGSLLLTGVDPSRSSLCTAGGFQSFCKVLMSVRLVLIRAGDVPSRPGSRFLSRCDSPLSLLPFVTRAFHKRSPGVSEVLGSREEQERTSE